MAKRVNIRKATNKPKLPKRKQWFSPDLTSIPDGSKEEKFKWLLEQWRSFKKREKRNVLLDVWIFEPIREIKAEVECVYELLFDAKRYVEHILWGVETGIPDILEEEWGDMGYGHEQNLGPILSNEVGDLAHFGSCLSYAGVTHDLSKLISYLMGIKSSICRVYSRQGPGVLKGRKPLIQDTRNYCIQAEQEIEEIRARMDSTHPDNRMLSDYRIPEEKPVTLRAAHEATKIPIPTIRRWYSGKPPKICHTKIGGKVYVWLSEVKGNL